MVAFEGCQGFLRLLVRRAAPRYSAERADRGLRLAFACFMEIIVGVPSTKPVPLDHVRRPPLGSKPASSGPDALSRRTRSLDVRAFSNICIAVLALWTAGSCDRAGSASDAAHSKPATPDARIQELIEVLTPLTETVTSDIQDQKFLRGQELSSELRGGGREIGLAALRALGSGDEKNIDVERGLLDVAAHAAPADGRALLESLVTQYGPSLALRTEAVLLLAETSPERAIEILEPLVVRARSNQTLPAGEFLVKSWVIACEKTGRSPVKELCDVATNLFQEEAARIRATKELGRHTDPLAMHALQAILIESTGDGYIRRMAVQGLRQSLPRESACAVFRRVAEREADMNFAKFLGDVIEKHCAP